MMDHTARAVPRSIIERAITEHLFPAAVVEVGSSADLLWREAFGTLTFETASPPTSVDTPFDLASLTKPLATTTAVMNLVDAGRLRLEDRVGMFFIEWRGPDREAATVQDFLEHAAGLSARLLDVAVGRREFEHEICTMPLEYPLRTTSVYSDLGFILLGFLIADRGGASFAAQFDEIVGRLELDVGSDGGRLTFALARDLRRRAAPTLPMDADQRRGRLLLGEVHDTYAAALGGVAGHAGLFGSAGAVGAFARLLLKGARGDPTAPIPVAQELMARMRAKSTVPGSSRALGWETMLPTSSCGTRMSTSAFGHVGYTGTSLWIDPARDRYFVLLANRACGGGTPDQMRALRRAFHDALGDV